MRKEREITIKVIKDKCVNNKRLAEFFVKRYVEEENKKS